MIGGRQMLETTLLIGIGLLAIIAYIVTIFGGVIFVSLCLKLWKVSPKKKSSDEGLPRAGTLVGMTERAIVLTFGLLGNMGRYPLCLQQSRWPVSNS
jgi:hypothetical protein